MLKKRIIPCLDIDNGRTVKGVNFLDIVDVGCPIELARRYVQEGADELVFLDISATVENRKTLYHLVEAISEEINIPFTVGGGIRTIDDVHEIVRRGADKITINSSAVENRGLINEIANAFGSQCVVVAIDAKLIGDEWYVVTHGGRRTTDIPVLRYVAEAQEMGCGEILLTSMNHDGMKSGFAIDLLKKVCETTWVPVIASGGAGSMADFYQVFATTPVSAALAASIFHYREIAIPELKQYLKMNKIAIR